MVLSSCDNDVQAKTRDTSRQLRNSETPEFEKPDELTNFINMTESVALHCTSAVATF